MDKHEFLKKIDSLKEATELLLDHSETEIRNLKSENSRLSDKLQEADETIECLEEDIEKTEQDSRFILEGIHDNITTSLAMENLFENLDHIPISELESFINKYKPN